MTEKAKVVREKYVAARSWDAIVNRPISDEQRELARKVLAAVEARKNEDIDEWAERLAADVADAND